MRDLSPATLRELAADIELELSRLQHLEHEIDRASQAIANTPAQADLLYESLALKLHNFYTGCEKVLQLIATELNGGLPNGSDWHKRLLDRMSTEREGRPAVLRSTTADQLRPFLGFRHIVRYLYGFELEGDRIAQLVANYPAVWQQVGSDYTAFVAWLRQLAQQLEGA
jgi:hypothetical protein